MSFVHIIFKRKRLDKFYAEYDVISPDFSESGTEPEVIGSLILKLPENDFSYNPAEKMKSYFCPPEYFSKYHGDEGKVKEVCNAENLMCGAWSYQIYKKAKHLLDSKIFDKEANSGV